GGEGEAAQLVRAAPADVRGVVARREAAADGGGEVVVDLVHAAARRRAVHGPGERAHGDDQAGLLAYLADDRLGVRLARLDPAAGQRPPARVGRAAPPYQEEAARVVQHDRADTLYGHLTKI